MSTEVSTLANGLRVVTFHNPNVETAALGVWVGCGARHETLGEHGISHLLEHMAFKGTATRTARDIAEEIEQVGGELNAATSLETTTYYARVIGTDVPLAMDLLADILQRSRFDADELEREREVILQEIAATRDSPEEIGYDLLQEIAYPDQALGRPILGTPESIQRFVGGDLQAFLTARYRASTMVLSAAGAVDHDRIVRDAERLFSGFAGDATASPSPANYVGGACATEKPFEQAHVMLAFESPPYRDRAYYAAQVLTGLLGGGMSSRLFQEARERRGLCYSIYATCYGLADTGLLGVHAATGVEPMEELVEVVTAELSALAEAPPLEVEVARAKAQLKAGLLMGLESSSARAEQMARQTLLFDRLVGAKELIERVESVTAEDVRAVAARVIGKGAPTVVVVGAGSRSQPLAEAARQRLAGLAG
jgi:predicted Zn-dependent peptidase